MGDAATDGHLEGKRFMCAIFTQMIRNQELQKCRFCFYLIFFVWVVISQYRGSELLASLQGMWLGALCPGGETGSALTFPGIKEV